LASNNNLFQTLEKHRHFLEPAEYEAAVHSQRRIEQSIYREREFTQTTIQRSRVVESILVTEQHEQSTLNLSGHNYMSDLVSRLNRYEAENQAVMAQNNKLES
jgi:hypothetical protein